MVLRQGASHYEPITWDDAFKLLAEELNGLSSPDQATFYTSGKLRNEARRSSASIPCRRPATFGLRIRRSLKTRCKRCRIGRPGAGPCCVRGHSNVQGDRTMGIWERVPPAFLDALEQRYGFKPPREEGKDTVNSLIAMHRGDIKVFVSMGGNLLGAGPDTNFIAEALQRCSLTVAIATKLNRAHLVTGRRALLLPCLGRSEIDLKPDGTRQFVTVEDSMGIINPSRGHLPQLPSTS
jgi:anaerobic selenocysteine-containing dehydrogenase